MEKINIKIAIFGSRAFGSMWMTYLFFIFGFIPLFFPAFRDWLLYWSNTIQLWALPLLMVGGNLLRRDMEKMNKETHDTVMSELKILNSMCKGDGKFWG